jgi:hypothetical protein
LSQISRLIERYLLRAGATLGVVMRAGVVYEDLTHQPRGDAEKVRAVLPRYALIDQAEICLVNEGRGLQRVPGALAAHVVASQAVQLVVNEGSQLIKRRRIAFAPVY